MMKRAQFDEITRALLKREPFRPFVIEYEDGRQFVVQQPRELHSFGGSATYFPPDGSIHLIDNEEVKQVEVRDHDSGQFEQSLRSLLRREPFEPFTVELADGERFTVDRADAVSLGRGAAGFIPEDGPIHFFDWKKTLHMGQEINGDSA